MTDEDFIFILSQCYGKASPNRPDNQLIAQMVFANKLCREQLQGTRWGLQSGGPFEFNLRDLTRWMNAIIKVYKKFWHIP
jgi:midasin (ATPase involved in ribosome maturation)